jgi:hypothetical protein
MEKQPARPAKPTIKMEMMFITPDLASSWLAKNGANRNVSSKRVTAMASDISSGRFLPTHQGVAFDDQDKLCDGQHRLNAIVSANRGVWMFVASNVPTDAMGVLDSGRSRTVSDRVAISDKWEHSKSIVAMARHIAELELGRIAGISDQQVVSVARRELQHFAWVAAKKGIRFTSYAPVGAALAYSRPVITSAAADDFADRLISGELLAPGSPILALRHHLEKRGRGGAGTNERMADFRRSLNAIMFYSTGEPKEIIRDGYAGVEWVLRLRNARGLPIKVD